MNTKPTAVTDITVRGVVRPSTCHDNPGAVDFRVTLRLDGELVAGELTLLPRDCDGALDSWGSPEHWVSGALLDQLDQLPDDQRLEVFRDLVLGARLHLHGLPLSSV